MVEERSERQPWIVMHVVLVGLTLMFFLSFFNRFAGLRSGDGEYGGGMALLSGHLPYRDFFTASPPLNMVKSAILLKIFGTALIVSRTAGVVERVLLALLLFRWLVQLFRPWHALVASVITIIVSAGDLTDPIASYNHDAVLFAMIAGLCVSLVLEGGSQRRAVLLALASGASAGLGLLTKQTVGLGAMLCVSVAGVTLLWKLDGPRRAVLWLASFAAGCAIPLAAMSVWLWRQHILLTFFRMLFVTGPEAKAGRPIDFLIRDWQVAWDNPLWVLPALIGLALSWRAVGRGLQTRNLKPVTRNEQILWLVAGVVLIGAAQAMAFTSVPALHDFSKCSVYYVFLGLTVWLPVNLAVLLRPDLSRRAAQVLLMGAVSWTVAFMFSLSWPVFEAMAVPGLGFLLAALLDGLHARFRWFAMLVMATMVFLQVRDKLDLPFGFDGMNEAPVRFATAVSDQPQLRGLRLPPEMVRFLDDATKLVVAHTGPGDTIFTYPEMGLLYSLTERQPATRSGSHNMDVVNDAFAGQEAARILSTRPAVIFYYSQSEENLREQERMWRHGQRSGQRAIIAAIQTLAQSYRLAGSYTVAPGAPPIEVYVRP